MISTSYPENIQENINCIIRIFSLQDLVMKLIQFVDTKDLLMKLIQFINITEFYSFRANNEQGAYVT